MASEPSVSDPAGPPSPPGRRDAVRNYHRVLNAAREVLGESGADASMEEIAQGRARCCSSGAPTATPGGDGLEQFLRGLGALFAAHAKYAHLLLERSADGPTTREIRAAVQELTSRALAAGTLNPGVTVGDVMALVWGMRGLTETTGEVAPGTWQRFLDIHLAGLRTPGPLSATPSMSAGQLAELLPRP